MPSSPRAPSYHFQDHMHMKPTSKKKKSILNVETPRSKDLFSFQTVTKCQCFPLPAKEPAFDAMGGISGAKREGPKKLFSSLPTVETADHQCRACRGTRAPQMLQGDERQAVGSCWWLWGAGPALFVLQVPWQGGTSPLFTRRQGRAGRDNAELLGRFPTQVSCYCPGRMTVSRYFAGPTVVPLISSFLICRRRYVPEERALAVPN